MRAALARPRVTPEQEAGVDFLQKCPSGLRPIKRKEMLDLHVRRLGNSKPSFTTQKGIFLQRKLLETKLLLTLMGNVSQDSVPPPRRLGSVTPPHRVADLM